MGKVIKFPYYSGNIRLTKVMGTTTLEEFIKAHKRPRKSTLEVLERVAEAAKKKDFKLKRELKHQLYSFTPSIMIKIGDKRKYSNVVKFTGLMQLDFDGLESKKEARELKETIFKNKEVLCVYLSPSGLGVKALIKITKPRDKEHYIALHKGMVSKYEQYSYLDESTKNAVLPLFLSADKDILYRKWDEAETFKEEDWSVVTYESLNVIPPPTSNKTSDLNDKDAKYFLRITTEIFTKKINGINESGHPQVRNASLILGSRCAAGYIDFNEAIRLATNLINDNKYLSKGVKGYIDTAVWGIKSGYKSPRYY